MTAASSPEGNFITRRVVAYSTRRINAGRTDSHGPWWLFDLYYGIVSGFPVCCVLRFSITNAFRPGYPQAQHRGCAYRKGGEDGVFVPCNWFHATQKSWEDPSW